MLASGYDSSDVDEVSFDNTVGVDKGGIACSCSNNGGAVGYGVVGPVDVSEYSDIVRLFNIGGGAGKESIWGGWHSAVIDAAVVLTEVGVFQ